MYCLKCGRDTKLPDVFCQECIDDMATCPVRSDVVINLPYRPEPTIEKKSRKKRKSTGEQLHSLRRLILWLCLFIVVLTSAVCMLTYWLLALQNEQPAAPPPGQNYSTLDPLNNTPSIPTESQG